MTKKKRCIFSPEQKVLILKKHLIDRTSVSDICDEFRIQPTQFYQWQKTFFEKGFRSKTRKPFSKKVLSDPGLFDFVNRKTVLPHIR